MVSQRSPSFLDIDVIMTSRISYTFLIFAVIRNHRNCSKPKREFIPQSVSVLKGDGYITDATKRTAHQNISGIGRFRIDRGQSK